MKTRKPVLTAVFIVIILIVIFVLKTLYQSGAFKSINEKECCDCLKVENLPGTEDIVIDRDSGIAFLSSHDRRAYVERSSKNGTIFIYPLDTYPGNPVPATRHIDFPFHPHGISLYKTDNGKLLLFVINHRDLELTTVEIFEYAGGTLTHVRSVESELMISPNDLLAVGDEQFYFTNDHGTRSEFTRALEDYFQLPLGSVVFCSGSDCRTAARGFTYTNGIALSRDGMTLYVSSTTGRFLRVLDRNPSDHTLKKRKDLKLNTGLDNIDVDEEGNLWVTGHPKLLTFVKHASDPGVNSPSQILRIDPENDFAHETVYVDSGEKVSGASVAARFRNRLLVGTVFEPFILDCRFK